MEPAATLHIHPWDDTVVDRVGHDPRSPYVEQFWLGVLGPSTTWFLRLVAHRLDDEPDGFDLDLGTAAGHLGLAWPAGRNSPFLRTLERAVRFGMARESGPAALDVRRRLPPLNRHQLRRLPAAVQEAHADWQAQLLANDAFLTARRRARRLALSLFELGEDAEGVERELHRWKHHPAVAADATRWAHTRHRAAAAAAVGSASG